MLAQTILGLRRKRQQDDKPTIGVIAIEVLVGLGGIVAAVYSYSQVTGTVAHQHLVYLILCYIAIIVSLSSFWASRNSFTYYCGCSFVMFGINLIFMLVVPYTHYKYKGVILVYSVAYYTYPAYMVVCTVMFCKLISQMRGII